MKDFLKVGLIVSIFAVLLLPLFVSGSMFFPYITGKNFAFRILVEIGIASWALLALWDAAYRPRFSWLLASGATLLGVMFLADAFGEYAPKSFWSNYERMDGYVTLVHFFGYFLLVSHTLRTPKLWSYFFHTSLTVSFLVAFIGLQQNLNGIGRVDATLGNSTYMAVYMLFALFITALVSLKSSSWGLRALYGAMGLFFTYILLMTGTRGTFVGLSVGLLVAVVYVAVFGSKMPELRKVAIGGLLALTLFGGIFYSAKNTDFVQSSPSLSRYANLNLTRDLAVRATIWSVALEGVKERPILGWGQENFNYVFNKYYKPDLYGQEQWFDRTHDIVFDWLIAGGVVGLLAYLSVLLSAFYYLFWLPLFKGDDTFSVPERALLIGLLAAYFLHNLVVFDNIISYIFYAIILAYIHARVARPIPTLTSYRVNEDVAFSVVSPVVAVVLVAVIYFVNVPSMLAAHDIISALTTQTVTDKLEQFEKALARGGFADQEIVEQMSQATISTLSNTKVSVDDKNKIYQATVAEFDKFITKKPGDARLYMLLSTVFQVAGQPESAIKTLQEGEQFSPKKQTLLFAEGLTYISMGETDKAREVLERAYRLDESFDTAKIYYALSLLYVGEKEEALSLIGEEALQNDDSLKTALTNNDTFARGVIETNNYDVAIDVFKERVAKDPTSLQNRINLVVAYYKNGNTKEAFDAVEKIQTDGLATEEQKVQMLEQLQLGNF